MPLTFNFDDAQDDTINFDDSQDDTINFDDAQDDTINYDNTQDYTTPQRVPTTRESNPRKYIRINGEMVALDSFMQ